MRLTDRIATVLRWANSDPFATKDREGFYLLKQAICSRWGVLEGHDIQRVVYECWTCDGTGFYEEWDCYRCSGGIHKVLYFELERWRLGRFVFHRPLGKVDAKETQATIHGKIKHSASTLALCAALALSRAFETSLFLRWLGNAPNEGFGKLVKASDALAHRMIGDRFCNWDSVLRDRLQPAFYLSLPKREEIR